MSTMKYSLAKDGNTNLSAHFKVREFRCKDGSDTIILNPELIVILEKLFSKLNAYSITITSGYRTAKHSVAVGGYSTDQHTKGNAADIKVKKTPSTYYTGKQLCLALEDLNHAGGIGYINSTSVHLDVRGKKAWFDETNGEKTTSSWYAYWGINKPSATASHFPKYTGSSLSLVDALKSLKADSSFSNRKKIAKVNGISAYIGTGSQNTKLLNLLKSGKLIKP